MYNNAYVYMSSPAEGQQNSLFSFFFFSNLSQNGVLQDIILTKNKFKKSKRRKTRDMSVNSIQGALWSNESNVSLGVKDLSSNPGSSTD